LKQVLAWWGWQVRFWDIASGEEVRQVAASEFAFDVGAELTAHRTNHHLMKAYVDTLVITERLPHGGAEDIEGGAAPVAYFRAPQHITSVRCNGASICVGCEGGAVCILHAPFLAV
jgi:hypothetical protein